MFVPASGFLPLTTGHQDLSLETQGPGPPRKWLHSFSTRL